MDSENFTMPVQPMNYGYPMMGGYGYGNGLFGGDWSAILIIFLFAMMGGGFGGWGGGFGGWGLGNEITFPWLLNGQQGINANTDAAINQLSTNNTLSTLGTAINTGFSNAEVAACNRAMDAQATAYNNQIASMNQRFADVTAIGDRLDTIAMNQQTCCCENRASVADLKYTVATEAAASRAASTANTQAILDKLCQQEIDALKTQNANLQTQVNMQALAASQAQQTAALVADNTAQTQALINRIAPYPTPSFIVGNPYGYNGYGTGYGYGCGCNSSFGVA